MTATVRAWLCRLFGHRWGLAVVRTIPPDRWRSGPILFYATRCSRCGADDGGPRVGG